MECANCKKNIYPDSRYCKWCGTIVISSIDAEEILNYGECPYCRSYKIKVYKVAKPWRYIRCLKCGKTARSLEVWTLNGDYLKNAKDMLEFLDQSKK